MKIGQYLAKIWTQEYSVRFFLGHPVYGKRGAGAHIGNQGSELPAGSRGRTWLWWSGQGGQSSLMLKAFFVSQKCAAFVA